MTDRANRYASLLGEARASIAQRAAERTALMQRLRPRRRPPEAGIAIPAAPPRGPFPRHGGAAASLHFQGD